MINANWNSLAAGVWTWTFGQGEDALAAAYPDAKPRFDALQDMPSADFPADLAQANAEVASNRTVIRLPLAPGEEIYGLGLQFMRMNHRAKTRYLRTNSDPRDDRGETHAPVPMFVTSRGYAILVKTCRAITVHAGSTVRRDSKTPPVIRDRTTNRDWKATPYSDTLEIVIPFEQGAELLLFGGPDMLDAIRRYNLWFGGGALPPKWGLGFWNRVSIFADDKQALAEAQEFRSRRFPCDVIGLEPGWHSGSYPTTCDWSPARFPDPATFVGELAADGFRVNLWENPYISPASSLHAALEPHAGSHTVWGGLVTDLTSPEARAIVSEHHGRQHADIGVSGYKIDEVDGSEQTRNSWMFPAHARFPSGLDGEQMRQLYGALWQRTLDAMFRSRNRRTYGLVRATTYGTNSLPFVLYSDLYDHRQFVRALCNASFSGLLWSPEVRGAQNAEDFVRRIQTVIFSPLAMLNGWATSIKPWTYPEEEPIVRRFLELRMRLIPYLYSAFARYTFEGLPPFRAMQLEFRSVGGNKADSASALDQFDDGEAAYGRQDRRELDDQYMAGDSLLVAPLFAGETERDVWLPPGVWYDFDDALKQAEQGEHIQVARYEGGQLIRISAGLDKLPVFAREGAIVPMMPVMQHVPAAGERVPLEILHIGGRGGSFRLYDDDGETCDYESGKRRWIELTAVREADGSWSGHAVADADDAADSPSNYGYSELVWRWIR